MTVAEAPTASDVGTPLNVVAGTSLQVMLPSGSLPVLVTTAEKLIGWPGALAFVQVFVTLMLGDALIVHVALADADTVRPNESVPEQVSVSTLLPGLWVGT